jgi:hypothetical protein
MKWMKKLRVSDIGERGDDNAFGTPYNIDVEDRGVYQLRYEI